MSCTGAGIRLPGSAGRAYACRSHSQAGGDSAGSPHPPGPWRVGLAVCGAIPRRDQSKALTVPNTWQRPGSPRCLAVVAWENRR